MDEWMDRWLHGWMDGWMDGSIDRWMCSYVFLYRYWYRGTYFTPRNIYYACTYVCMYACMHVCMYVHVYMSSLCYRYGHMQAYAGEPVGSFRACMPPAIQSLFPSCVLSFFRSRFAPTSIRTYFVVYVKEFQNKS